MCVKYKPRFNFLIGYGSYMIACARPNSFDHRIHMHAGAKGNKFLGFYIIQGMYMWYVCIYVAAYICTYVCEAKTPGV